MPSNFRNTAPASLGNLIDFSATPNGLSGKTSKGKFNIAFYSEEICRVSITCQDDFEDFSYAVVGQPASVAVQLEEQDNKVIVRTSLIHLTVTRNPVRFSFADANGNVLNEDEPGLGTAWIGDQVTTYKRLQEGERFIGLGEKTGALDRRGSGYQNWTTDAYAYHGGQDPLYCSTPFYIGIHRNRVYGIYLDNTHKTFFNFAASNDRFSSFGADAGEMNYYFMAGGSVSGVIRNYTWLTGRMELPPIWSIGYQQCRYSYYPDKEISTLARTFREKDIPSDVIVLDIHYMDKYKIFTWDKKNFTDPKALLDEIKKLGFHIVVMCDPGIKIEPGYEAYDDGISKDVFIKYPDQVNYAGQVWPGWCHFPDFTNPRTRAWWASKFSGYVDIGVDGFWNDMNEIATWGNALPENLVFDFDGNPASARRGRNVFGFQMARSTYEGTKALLKGKRPFNLTRSGFSGVQRYAAVWTGDNVSYDEHMLLGVRMVSSLGLTGVAFAGYDVGGFVGDANTKLFARWISIGALSPFFRGHTMINSRDAEPWSFGEEVEQIARNYIKFRYQLMPYIYSLFYEAAVSGMPVQRSLAIDYSFDHRVYDHQFHNQYLLGPSILVAPVESNRELMKVFLPPGDWYYLFTGKKYTGDQEIYFDCPIHRLPVFVKAGALLPMQKAMASTNEKSDELILHVYAGAPSSFLFFEDDGETYDYQNGTSLKRLIHYLPEEGKLILEEATGSYRTQFKTLKLVLHHWHGNSISVGGVRHSLQEQTQSFFTPLEKYDPIHDPESMGEEGVKWCVVAYATERMEVNDL